MRWDVQWDMRWKVRWDVRRSMRWTVQEGALAAAVGLDVEWCAPWWGKGDAIQTIQLYAPQLGSLVYSVGKVGDGMFVEIFDGTCDGAFDGTCDGTCDRMFDGTCDGTFDGTFDGRFNGKFDGTVHRTFDVTFDLSLQLALQLRRTRIGDLWPSPTPSTSVNMSTHISRRECCPLPDAYRGKARLGFGPLRPADTHR